MKSFSLSKRIFIHRSNKEATINEHLENIAYVCIKPIECVFT